MSESLIVVCPHCHTPNRVPAARLDAGAGGTCGKCKGALFTGAPVEVDAAAFDKHVGRAGLPIVVDFWAPWCGPCRMMGPIVDAMAEKYAGQIKVTKVNVDEAGDIAGRYGIRSIPTLMIFKGGQQVDTVVGAVPESELSGRLDKVV